MIKLSFLDKFQIFTNHSLLCHTSWRFWSLGEYHFLLCWCGFCVISNMGKVLSCTMHKLWSCTILDRTYQCNYTEKSDFLLDKFFQLSKHVDAWDVHFETEVHTKLAEKKIFKKLSLRLLHQKCTRIVVCRIHVGFFLGSSVKVVDFNNLLNFSLCLMKPPREEEIIMLEQPLHPGRMSAEIYEPFLWLAELPFWKRWYFYTLRCGILVGCLQKSCVACWVAFLKALVLLHT